VGIASPGTPPSRIPAVGSHRPYFVHMLYLAYINIILLASSNHVTTETCEIKIEKSATPCWTSTTVDPAKRTRIGLAMLDFRTEQCQLTTRA